VKIDAGTLTVLKSFMRLNPSIVVKPGNVLATMSTNKAVMGKATVTTSFEVGFAIYDLDRFIRTLSLFNDPDFNFEEKWVDIREGGKKTRYVYADESFILKAPDKSIKLPSVDASAKLTDEVLKQVLKANATLGLPEVVFRGDGVKIYVEAADTKNPTGDVFSVEIGETDKTFSAVFKTDNLQFIPGNYDVEISSKGLSHFTKPDVEYYATVEKHSTF
jgi:hypothetical protein